LWDFKKWTSFIVNTIVKLNPISHVLVYFIDGSLSGKGGIHGHDLHETIQTNYSCAQQVELKQFCFIYCKKLQINH
jgi:hypothetical protein